MVMVIKNIINSPGYKISEFGNVYNSNNIELKTFKSSDGYLRISIPSLYHSRRVKRSIHKLVTETYINNGKVFESDVNKQINHIDGNKLNNHYSNLEIVTNTENVNKAHDLGLYKYDVSVKVKDIETNEIKWFRSLREVARYFNVSLNFIKPRIIISNKYPFLNKYNMDIDYINYIKFISKIKNNKKIYVYSHITRKEYTLTSYSQISILYGLPYTTIGKKFNRDNNTILYSGGYTFSLNKLSNINFKSKKEALLDRDTIWLKVMANK